MIKCADRESVCDAREGKCVRDRERAREREVWEEKGAMQVFYAPLI